MAWTKLAKTFPEVDEPILVKNHGKTFFGIREQDERGDFIHCQERENGDFVFSINLYSPFNDESFEWRNLDD